MAGLGPFRALARRLNQVPNGFPPTESGVELRILARLFRPEEAELAAHLRLTPEPAAAIAARTGQEPATVRALLKGMARRGLIRAERGPGGLHYALLPFAVGFYEFIGDRLDAELAQLVEAYFAEAHPAIFAVEPALQRVIPVEEAVSLDVEILPYERASAMLDEAKAWGVVDCICRREKQLIGQGCGRPLDVCLVLSAVPGAFDGAGSVRALTREEASDVLRRAEEAGLVHSTSNTRTRLPYLWYICNCCPCCCGVMRGVAEFGLARSVAHSAFVCVVDAEGCAGCQACQERCPFGALRIEEGIAQVDVARCAGCGLCAAACPSSTLRLERRAPEDILPVPIDLEDWWAARAHNRGINLGRVL